MILDRFAYENRWSSLHPAVKTVLTGFGLTASLLAASPWVPLLVMISMASAAVVGAGIPVKVFTRLLLVPAGFLFAGTSGLAVTFTGGDLHLFTLPLVDLPLGLSCAGLNQAGMVLLRSLGAVTCLHLLALTTPMTEIFALLRRVGVPQLLLELAMLAYSQLFVLLKIAREMALAQQSRLGYAGFVNSMRSLVALGANLFILAHQRSRRLHRGLVGRGYEETLCWLEPEVALPFGPLILAITTGGTLVALALLVPG